MPPKTLTEHLQAAAEAEASPNGKPAEVEPVEGPVTLRLDFDDLDAGDLEDIAEYAGRDDVLMLVLKAYQAADKAEPGDQVEAMMAALPPKVFTALLGVGRRHADPGWTPEHWRKFRFADLVTAGDDEDPTSAGSTPGSTSAPTGSARSPRTRRPSGTKNGSGPMRR